MLLSEIKQLLEGSSSYPDIKIERHPDAGFVVYDANTYDGAPDDNNTMATDHKLEDALDSLHDILLNLGMYSPEAIDDSMRTALTVFKREQMDNRGIQDERPRHEYK